MSFIILFIIVNLITLVFSLSVEKYWFPDSWSEFWNKLETPFKIYGKEVSLFIYPYYSWIGFYKDTIGYFHIFPVFGIGISIKTSEDAAIEHELIKCKCNCKSETELSGGWQYEYLGEFNGSENKMVGRVRAYRPVKAGSISSEKLNEDPPTGGTGFVADTELKVVKKIIKCDGKEFKLEKNYMMGKELYELLGVDPSKKVLKAWASQWSTESFLCGGEQLFFVPDGMEYHTSDIPAPKPVNVFFGGNLVELESNRMKGIELYEALNCNAEKYKLWLAGKEYVEPNESEVKILDRMQIYSSTRKITANLKTEDIELRFEKKSFYVKSEGYYPNLLLYKLFDVNPKTHNLWFYDIEKGEDVLVETGEDWKMDIRKNRYFSSSPKKINN